MAMPMQPLRRPITADSALMNPNARILALKGTQIYHLPGSHQPLAALGDLQELPLLPWHI
jgi:hypothetical protein